MEKEKFRRRFPSLASEVEEDMTNAPSDSVTAEEIGSKDASLSSSERPKKKAMRGFDGYDPDAVDFIRRCGSEKEALEIIEYLEQKGEIGKGEAQRMRSQLKSKGLRSFGAKKEYGYYMRNLE